MRFLFCEGIGGVLPGTTPVNQRPQARDNIINQDKANRIDELIAMVFDGDTAAKNELRSLLETFSRDGVINNGNIKLGDKIITSPTDIINYVNSSFDEPFFISTPAAPTNTPTSAELVAKLPSLGTAAALDAAINAAAEKAGGTPAQIQDNATRIRANLQVIADKPALATAFSEMVGLLGPELALGTIGGESISSDINDTRQLNNIFNTPECKSAILAKLANGAVNKDQVISFWTSVDQACTNAVTSICDFIDSQAFSGARPELKALFIQNTEQVLSASTVPAATAAAEATARTTALIQLEAKYKDQSIEQLRTALDREIDPAKRYEMSLVLALRTGEPINTVIQRLDTSKLTSDMRISVERVRTATEKISLSGILDTIDSERRSLADKLAKGEISEAEYLKKIQELSGLAAQVAARARELGFNDIAGRADSISSTLAGDIAQVQQNIAARTEGATKTDSVLRSQVLNTPSKAETQAQITANVNKAFGVQEGTQSERLENLKAETRQLEDKIIETNIQANRELNAQLQTLQTKALEANKTLQTMVQGLRETLALLEKSGKINNALLTILEAQLSSIKQLQTLLTQNVARLSDAQDPVKALDPAKNKVFETLLNVLQEARVYAEQAAQDTQRQSAIATAAAIHFITAAKTSGVAALSKDYFIVVQLLKNIEAQQLTEQTQKIRDELKVILSTYNAILDDGRMVQKNIQGLELKRNVNKIFEGLITRADEDVSWKVKLEIDNLRASSANKNKHLYAMAEVSIADQATELTIGEMRQIFDKLPKAVQEQLLLKLAKANPEKLIALLKTNPLAAELMKDLIGKLEIAQLVKLLESGALKLEQLPQALRDKLTAAMSQTKV